MGTRDAIRAAATTSKDHPHAYGDKSYPQKIFFLPKLSSPRVWGQEIYDKLTEMRARIIPTRMGTSDYIINKILIIWDHPHAYGDKPDTLEKTGNIEKSSPRVWGQAIIAGTMLVLSRIIPTRMGTS